MVILVLQVLRAQDEIFRDEETCVLKLDEKSIYKQINQDKNPVVVLFENGTHPCENFKPIFYHSAQKHQDFEVEFSELNCE